MTVVCRALGPADSELAEHKKEGSEHEHEHEHGKHSKVDRLISKFFRLHHSEEEEKPVTTDVATSEKILEDALANNHQPAIPADAVREREISFTNLFPCLIILFSILFLN